MTHHKFYCGDALGILKQLPSESVNCCVTSPHYFGLRDYGVAEQIGLEQTPEEYVNRLVEIFREVRRVLKDDETLWLNLGDTYNAGRNGGHPGGKKQWRPKQGKYLNRSGVNAPGLKPKDLVGIPWRVAFALQANGWYLRSDIIWYKPNPMPESVKDRPTKAHEYIFLLTKSPHYYYDQDAIRESARPLKRKCKEYGNGVILSAARNKSGPVGTHPKGRNKRTVWTVATNPFKGAHFAVFPPDLIKPCILAGCPEGGTVLDPFSGSGTTSMVAKELGRNSVYIDMNPKYLKMALKRVGFGEYQQTNIFNDSYEVIGL